VVNHIFMSDPPLLYTDHQTDPPTEQHHLHNLHRNLLKDYDMCSMYGLLHHILSTSHFLVLGLRLSSLERQPTWMSAIIRG